MVELDIVTLDREKLVRKLTAAGVDPRVIEIFDEMHDTQRTMQKLLEDLMQQQGQMLQALSLMNVGFKKYAERLQGLEKKYGTSAVTDILKEEHHGG